MSVYKCTITTTEGRALTRTIVADSVAAAKERIAQEGHFLLDIQKSAGDSSFFSFAPSRPLKPKEFISFNHEFAVLLRSGMPIMAALDMLIKKEGNKRFQSILKEIMADVSHGESLSTAFSKHEHIFSPTYSAALKAGESDGTVSQAISKYVDSLKRAERIKQKVKAASIYPVILSFASFFVVIFLMIFVVPAITSSFTDSGAELPFMTQLLMSVADFLKSQYLWFIAVILVFVVALKISLGSDYGKNIVHKWILKLPYIGSLTKAYAVSRFTSTLSTLLSSGFTLNGAVDTASGLVSNSYIRSGLRGVVADVEKGEGFSESLKKIGVFPELAVSMIVAGEQSSSLEEILMELSSLYEDDVENGLTSLTSIIEPMLMILMGFVIGFIVLALYMPVFQLAGTV
ncbi:putative Type 4 fimbrial assembly protein pilC [Desulfamplus magnetovallimortis]|uniref:Putative Type 4 fimbrial assembly protein pilC n=1 Tax=Desulfamplus magnetovallimortis TaxID=1246637 RepID=A0A1W1HDU2_9BACT|nr:type II secretion system F family protein [Desulfamplus magnetovallimortis]SLM30649.1 putative Type 4 fimbrial assembly protein pilC [Desulfamplus magnetovallimortis]